jgi:hypothetical protein
MPDPDTDNTNNSAQSNRDLRQRAIDAYDAALDSASDAGRRAGDAIVDAPFVALGAGLAVGAIAAALLPTTRRERALLSPVGGRISNAARDAADAARSAGSDKLRDLGLTPDTLFDKASEAARATAQAAVGKFKDSAGQD